jgi:hypothetical protein
LPREHVSAKLDASVEASGPHDFAVGKSARSSAALIASTASRPAFVTITIRPFEWNETARVVKVFLPSREAKNFSKGGLDSPNQKTEQ